MAHFSFGNFKSIRTKVIWSLIVLFAFITMLEFVIVRKSLVSRNQIRALLMNDGSVTECVHEALSAAFRGMTYLYQEIQEIQNGNTHADTYYQDRLERSVKRFYYFIKALTWGTEAPPFTRLSLLEEYKPWAAILKERNIRITEVSPLIQNLSGAADLYFHGFSKYAQKSVESFYEEMEYIRKNDIENAERAHKENETHLSRAAYFQRLTVRTLESMMTAVDNHTVSTQSSIDQNQKSLLVWSLIIGFAFFMGVLGAALLVTERFILRPIKELTEKTEEVGRGNLDIKLPHTLSDEIGRLSVSFQKMTENLRYTTVSRDSLLEEIEKRQKLKCEIDQFFSLSLDLFCIADFNGYLKRVNFAWMEVLGYTEDELLNRPYVTIIHPDDRQRTRAEAEALSQSKNRTLSFENRLLKKDGSYRYFLWNATSSFKDNVIYASARDITEWKEAESELKRANADLAEHKSELLKTLVELKTSHRKLQEAQLQLVQAAKLESVGCLAAGVAHEVKNPLAIIQMGIDFLSNGLKKDTELNEVVADMGRAVGRANSVIRGLLNFASPNELNIAEENIQIVLESSLQLLRHEINKYQIQVNVTCEKVGPVYIDRNKIQQVFVNIIMNAIQAMKTSGCINILVHEKQMQMGDPLTGSRNGDQFRPGDEVLEIIVMDSGPGLDQKTLERVFDPFFTTKPTGEGTGLGLSVTKKIVEMHHGSIRIFNRPEGGACSVVYLPRVLKEEILNGKTKTYSHSG